jgi:hypothetical protein
MDLSWLEDNSAGADFLVRQFNLDALEIRLR